jgi:hypothetical protein
MRRLIRLGSVRLGLLVGLVCLLFAATGASAHAFPATSCIGTTASGGAVPACFGVPASASIGDNSCNGEGFEGGYGACGFDNSLISVGAGSCNGFGFNGACARNLNLTSVGAGSCNGFGDEDTCVVSLSLISVGPGSCNGDGACSLNSLISVGANSCNGPDACNFGSNVTETVGDCQNNTVPVAACAFVTGETVLEDGNVILFENGVGPAHQVRGATPDVQAALVALAGDSITVEGTFDSDLVNSPILVQQFEVNPGGAFDGDVVTITGPVRILDDGRVIVSDQFGRGHRLDATPIVPADRIASFANQTATVVGTASVTNPAGYINYPIVVRTIS